MLTLKFVDRVAVVAMFTVIAAIPVAARAVETPGESAPKRAHVLDDRTFQAIRPGMTARDVLALIGAPLGKARFESTRTTAWDYRFRDSWGYAATFSVILDDADVVVGKFTKRDSDG
jgi:outer membrane protein assembly factor BamE (lipoprotein component of BamABCDE complex)